MLGVQIAQLILVSVLWLVLLLGGVWTAARSPWVRTLSRRDLVLLGLCLLVALVARLSARTFLSNMQPDAAQGLAIGSAHRWGAAYSALLHFAYLFAPATVETAARLNVLFSLATVVAAFVLVDVCFRQRLAAFAAAAVLALQPVSVRYAASDAAAVVVTFATITGAAFMAAWGRGGERRQLWQGIGWFVLAANIRYEALIYSVAGAAVALGAGGWPDRQRLRQLLVGVALGLVFLAYPVGVALFDASQGVFELSPMGWIGAFVLSPHSPRVIVALAVVGLAGAAVGHLRETVGYLVALAVVSMPGFYPPFDCSDLSYRFALPQLVLWAGLAGYGFHVGHRLLVSARRRWWPTGGAAPDAVTSGRLPWAAALVALALAAAVALPHRGFLSKMWTYALEYEFTQEHLAAIPDGCLLIGPASDWEIRGLRVTELLSRLAGREHRWLRVDSPEVLAGRVPACTVYYHATACYAFEGILRPNAPPWVGRERDVCARMNELYDLEPIATTSFPSVGYACERHSVEPVPAGFYRARPKAGPPPIPATIPPATPPDHAQD